MQFCFSCRLGERPWNPTDGTVPIPYHFLSDSRQWWPWVTESQHQFPEYPGHQLTSLKQERGPLWLLFDQQAAVLVVSPSVLAGQLVQPRLAAGVEVIVGGVTPPLWLHPRLTREHHLSLEVANIMCMIVQ